MLCVATIGMQRACRASEKNFSSPDGSFSPVVAKAWYSSHTKQTERNGCVAAAVVCGMVKLSRLPFTLDANGKADAKLFHFTA